MVILGPLFLYVFIAVINPVPTLYARTVLPAVVSGDNIELAWPSTGNAAIGSLDEGVLRTSSADIAPKPTASIAKVITALAVLEKKPIAPGSQGQVITLDQTDIDFYNYYSSIDGSVVPVVDGEQITQSQMLDALLLPSANNIADSLAYWAFGSIDEYITYANAMVLKWGLRSTTIADASGLSPATMSTPSDLIIIGQKLLNNPMLRAVVAKKSANVVVAGTVYNTNILLGIDGINGIKTGHTDEAGAGILFSANHTIDNSHTVTIIGVIQSTSTVEESFANAQALLASAKKGFGKTTIVKKGDKLGTYSAKWGATSEITAQSDLIVYGWKARDVKPGFVVDNNLSNVSAKQKVGTLKVKITDKTYSTDLLTSNTIKNPNIWWRLRHKY